MVARTVALVERFLNEIWNNVDEGVARETLDENFRFRGFLGSEERGRDGFIAYIPQSTPRWRTTPL